MISIGEARDKLKKCPCFLNLTIAMIELFFLNIQCFFLMN
jgi:hypothetical protein